MTQVEMALSRILIRENSDQQMIFLREKDGDRAFPIVIGPFEAFEIDRKIHEIETPRPMTHDLLRSVIRALGASIERVVVDDLRNSTFHAKIHLRRGDETVRVDARPSDAIALAVAEKVPIFVEEKVLEEVGRGES